MLNLGSACLGAIGDVDLCENTIGKDGSHQGHKMFGRVGSEEADSGPLRYAKGVKGFGKL